MKWRISSSFLLLLAPLAWNNGFVFVQAQQQQGNISSSSSNICNLTTQGTSFHLDDPELADCVFLALDPRFYSIIGESNTTNNVTLLLENETAIFHEGPVLLEDALYFTTNRLGDTSLGITWGATAPAQLEQYIDIYKLDRATHTNLTLVTPNPPILMANGMTNTAPSDGKNILATAQGFNDTGGGVYELDTVTWETTPILETFYGTNFNSLNDIKTTSDGRIMFITDPPYGFEQGFRYGNPQLGSNVYRYDTVTKDLQVLVTSLQRPNGLALLDQRGENVSNSGSRKCATGGCILYLTDSGFESGTDVQADRGFTGFGDSSIYYMHDKKGGCFEPGNGPWTLQALNPAVQGTQDGIHVHTATKLLFYCDGTGVWIWSVGGAARHENNNKPLGIIRIPCTQLIFPQDEGVVPLYILAETKLYLTELYLNSSILVSNKYDQQQHGDGGHHSSHDDDDDDASTECVDDDNDDGSNSNITAPPTSSSSTTAAFFPTTCWIPTGIDLHVIRGIAAVALVIVLM